MSSTAIPYDYAVGIERSDIDFMGHVNNASYLKWVQAAIISHWGRLAPTEAIADLLWVALKHEITYRKPAFLEDDVVATVVLEKVHGARAFYEVIIKHGEVVLASQIKLVLPQRNHTPPGQTDRQHHRPFRKADI